MTNLRSVRIDHNFERYANGKVWLWERGVDYHEIDRSFISRVRRYARINGILSRIKIVKDGIKVQFICPERAEGGDS